MFFSFLFSIIEFFFKIKYSWTSIVILVLYITKFNCTIKIHSLSTFQLLRISKTIDYKDAARIIGSHFPEIDDKIHKYFTT